MLLQRKARLEVQKRHSHFSYGRIITKLAKEEHSKHSYSGNGQDVSDVDLNPTGDYIRKSSYQNSPTSRRNKSPSPNRSPHAVSSKQNQKLSRELLEDCLHYHLRSCINPDIMIRIGNNDIYGHLALLRVYTDYFENAEMVEGSWKIHLPEEKVTAKAFETIYNWMLIGRSEAYKLLSRDNIVEVYMAAQYLSINELPEACKLVLEDESLFVEVDAFMLFLEGYKFRDSEIMDLMLPRIQKSFLNIASTNFFLLLPVKVVASLLQSDNLYVNSEIELFLVAIRWLLHDWKGRAECAITLMSKIRFGLMSPSQLVDIRRSPDCPEILEVTNIPEVSKWIDDGIAMAVKIQNLEGTYEEVRQACHKLGLAVPNMRNWLDESKRYLPFSEYFINIHSEGVEDL